MACKLSFVRKETVEKPLALERSYLVVFKYIGNWSGVLDSVDESTEPKTYYGSFMVESKQVSGQWPVPPANPRTLVCVMKACG